jgi:hypothetical protein
MSNGGQLARLPVSALDLDHSLAPGRHRTALVRRLDDRWVEVSRFGSKKEAQASLDEQVGSGSDDFAEYLVVTLPRSRREKVAIAVRAIGIAAAVGAFLLLYVLFSP